MPIGSTWRTGLSVSRPARLAVSSPNARAVTPWASSWRMMDGTATANTMIVVELKVCRTEYRARATRPITTRLWG